MWETIAFISYLIVVHLLLLYFWAKGWWPEGFFRGLCFYVLTLYFSVITLFFQYWIWQLTRIPMGDREDYADDTTCVFDD